MKKILALSVILLAAGCIRYVDIDYIDYQCEDKKVRAYYTEGGDVTKIVLEGKEYALTNAKAASGANYENKAANLSFWNKGYTNTLFIGDKYYDCIGIVDNSVL